MGPGRIRGLDLLLVEKGHLKTNHKKSHTKPQSHKDILLGIKPKSAACDLSGAGKEVNTKNKILVLTSTFPRWHGDKDPPFVFELCRRLGDRFSITVLAPHFPGSQAKENFTNIHVVRFRYFFGPLERLAYGSGGGILTRVRRNPAWGLMTPFLFVSQVLATIRLLRKENFDLIHAHWLIPQAVSAVIARSLSGRHVPLLSTGHGGDLYGLRGKVMDRIRKVVFKRSTALTVVSQVMARDIVKTGASMEKIHVIPMGTDLVHRFYPGTGVRNPKQVLFVGRLVEKKGCRYLIEAWPTVIKNDSEAKLSIVGDGPEREKLENRVRELRVGASVKFLGALAQTSLPDLYRSSGVVVFPSVVDRGGDREGFGLVPVEAMGCECAVVVTDLPAMEDIVQDGETGLVVRQKSSDVLAEAILHLLKATVFARRLGQNGRSYVLRRYDWEKTACHYRDLIESMIRSDEAHN
jgi:glycosyltransferase involved in cell wall biosynthesis